MITDANLQLCGSYSNGTWTAQAITASNQVSTNSVDTAPLALGGNQAGDYGIGTALEVAIQATTAPTVATSVEFQLITADDAALTTNVTIITSSGAIPIANLTATAPALFKQVVLRWDRASPNAPRRYVGLRFVVVGTATSAGSYLAEIVASVGDTANTQYKSGFAIL